MAGKKTKNYPRFYDLSIYRSDELIHLWENPEAMEYQGLMAASLMDEKTHFTVLSRMVNEPMDVLSGDNVNWALADLTEDILLSIIPKVDVSQTGGALLVLGWIHWVKGHLDLAKKAFQTIEEETHYKSALTYVMGRKLSDGVQPAVGQTNSP